MSRPVEDPRAAQARHLAQVGQWEAAATLYSTLADDLARTDPGAAAQAGSLAADAWRREDRPVAAARALRAALDRLPGEAGRSLLTVQLAGVLAEVGQLVPARDLALEARSAPGPGGVQELALDLLVGLHLELGELERAGAAAGALSLPLARAYREALVCRVMGRADQASAALATARDLVPDSPETAGLRAALAQEAGEQALLAADPEEALAAFQVAGQEWTRARRRSGLLRAAAGEVRARLALGQTPLARELVAAVDYAADRGQVPLECELLLARGAARARAALSGAEADLDRAVALAEATGARLLEGRSRQARRAAGLLRRDDASRAAALLLGTVWGKV